LGGFIAWLVPFFTASDDALLLAANRARAAGAGLAIASIDLIVNEALLGLGGLEASQMPFAAPRDDLVGDGGGGNDLAAAGAGLAIALVDTIRERGLRLL